MHSSAAVQGMQRKKRRFKVLLLCAFLKPFCRRKITYGFVLLSKIVLGVIPFRYVPNSFPNIETVYILIIIYCFFDFSEAYNVPCIW